MSAILEFADRLRARADIVDVVGRYVELRRAGNNLKGLCPFHREKSPSFNVSEDKGIFHCFGCGEGGDVIKFLQRIEKLEWIDAVRMLAEELHMELPQTRAGAVAAPDRSQRERVLQLMKATENFYNLQLKANAKSSYAETAQYLERRQITPEIVDKFRLGWAPTGWDSTLKMAKAGGFSEADMTDAGLAIRRSTGDGIYDRFRNRIMFPIHDQTGQTLAFGGRVFASDASPDEPKYINSPETPVYHKGGTLYALHLARKPMELARTALLMEGYLDVIRSHEFGFANAVATCGTALTDEQAKVLKRYCQTVVMIYDGDDAGRKAIVKGCEVLAPHDVTIKVVLLPDGHDPDSFLTKVGADAFSRLLENAVPYFQFLLEEAGRMHDRRTAEGKSKILEAIAPVLRRMNKSIQQTHYVEQAAGFLLTQPNVVLRTLSQVRTDRTQAELVSQLQMPEEENVSTLEAGLLKSMVESASARDSILAHVKVEWLRNDLIKRHFQTISAGSIDLTRKWDALLENADERDAPALRKMALDPVEPTCDERTVVQVAARLRLAFIQNQQMELLQNHAPNSDGGDDILGRFDGDKDENLQNYNDAFITVKRRPKT